ncbi:MAG TPA: hypothetical protein ENI99_03975 [Sedimenticola sp.]|nr:hypothetical protein [Sedimenticola sp.]
MRHIEVEYAAYHEAGHAVVALAHKRKVGAMHLQDSPYVRGWAECAGPPPVADLNVRPDNLRQFWPMVVNDALVDVAINLGGPIAEALFSYRPVGELVRSDSGRIVEAFERLAKVQDQIPQLAGFEHIRDHDLLSAVFLETAYRLSRLTAWRAVTGLAETLLRRKHLDEGEIMEVLNDVYAAPSQRRLFPGKRLKRHPVLIDSDRMRATYRQLCASRLARDNGYMEQSGPSRYPAIRCFDRYVARLRKRRIEKLEPLEWVKRLDQSVARYDTKQ